MILKVYNVRKFHWPMSEGFLADSVATTLTRPNLYSCTITAADVFSELHDRLASLQSHA